MRRVRSISLVALALSIVALTSSPIADAANPEFLGNVTGNTFTAKSGTSEIEDSATKLSIACKKDTVTLVNGKITGAKTIEVTVDIEECTLGGLSMNSLSDPSKTILVTAKGELCYIEKGAKPPHIGILLSITPVHVEVPSLGELIELRGTILGLIEPVNELRTGYKLNINSKTAKEKCEGGSTDVLDLEKEHNKKPLEALLVSAEELTLDKDIELMA